MNDLPKGRTFPISQEFFAQLEEYSREVEALADERQVLRDEYAEKMKNLGEQTSSRLHTLWTRLAASVGLDPEASWGNPSYQVETRYLEHGFGAIIFQPVDPNNPMSALFSAQSEANSDDPDEVPEGSTIN